MHMSVASSQLADLIEVALRPIPIDELRYLVALMEALEGKPDCQASSKMTVRPRRALAARRRSRR